MLIMKNFGSEEYDRFSLIRKGKGSVKRKKLDEDVDLRGVVSSIKKMKISKDDVFLVTIKEEMRNNEIKNLTEVIRAVLEELNINNPFLVVDHTFEIKKIDPKILKEILSNDTRG